MSEEFLEGNYGCVLIESVIGIYQLFKEDYEIAVMTNQPIVIHRTESFEAWNNKYEELIKQFKDYHSKK